MIFFNSPYFVSVISAVKKRVSCWLSGFVNEMRKKSPASIQKWVDSIADDDVNDESRLTSNETPIKEEILDNSKLSCDVVIDNEDASTSLKSGKNENLKVKLNEICNRLNVNETLKSKKTELKNLIEKTTLKLKSEPSTSMEQEQEQQSKNDDDDNQPPKDEEVEKVEELVDDNKNSTNLVPPQRAHISVLGRSSSENPKAKNKRLSDIGRSFSVANENDLPNNNNSSENLIYDADEDISITLPSPNLSSTTISNSTNQNNMISERRRSSLLQIKPTREHTVSEGHASPLIQPKNPLLRDSSFQVNIKRSLNSLVISC